MSEKQIGININLDGLSGQLCCSLQRIIVLVAAGLQNIGQLNPEFMELPTSFKIKLAPSLRWSKEVAQENYSEWILCNGFRDAIEAVGPILEEANRVLTIWEMAGQNGKFEINLAELQRIIFRRDQKFHRFGLPDKLSHLRCNHNFYLDDRLSSHVSSFNTARNCIVHRVRLRKGSVADPSQE